jgi:hypothetical protein
MVRLFDLTPALPNGDSLVLEAVPSADAMAAKLLSGELDAAVLPVNLAAKLHTSGLPYRLTAVVGQGMVSVVTTDPDIRSFEDLKGRETHVAGQGATPEYLLRTIAKKKGMDPDADMVMVFRLPYPEIAASIVADRISLPFFRNLSPPRPSRAIPRPACLLAGRPLDRSDGTSGISHVRLRHPGFHPARPPEDLSRPPGGL